MTAATFMAVLAGDKSKVSNTTGSSGRVLDSKAEDHVFVYFSDHGAPGIISMPVGPFVYADQLLSTLRARHAANGFGSMVLYIEACESGSMFEGLLEEDLNIWAVTAANGKESSWGTYCPGQDPSPPPEFTTCLADLFSAAWMEDAEDSDACQETLQKQFDNVRLRTSQNNTYAQGSHVQHFGTLEMGENHTSAFLGSGTCKYQPGVVDNARSNAPAANSRRRDRLPQRDADLVHLRVAHERAAPGPAKSHAQRALARELAARAAVDDAIWAVAADLSSGPVEPAEASRDPRRGGLHLGRASWDELARAPLWRQAADWAGGWLGRSFQRAGAPDFAGVRPDTRARSARREAARRVVDARVAPPSGRARLVDDWDCLRGMVAAWEDACGPLGQYGMKHSRAFANLCNAGRAPERLRARAEAVCTVPVRAVLRGEGLVQGAEE